MALSLKGDVLASWDVMSWDSLTQEDLSDVTSHELQFKLISEWVSEDLREFG